MSFENEFMQPEIVYGNWVVADGVMGTYIYPYEGEENKIKEIYQEMTGGVLWSAKVAYGFYSARLSAPGYLDCTDWIGVYDTEEEALKALEELYEDY